MNLDFAITSSNCCVCVFLFCSVFKLPPESFGRVPISGAFYSFLHGDAPGSSCSFLGLESAVLRGAWFLGSERGLKDRGVDVGCSQALPQARARGVWTDGRVHAHSPVSVSVSSHTQHILHPHTYFPVQRSFSFTPFPELLSPTGRILASLVCNLVTSSIGHRV